jgi:hypothetical protein
VHVVWKHDPGVDLKGCAGADPVNRIPQRVDLRHSKSDRRSSRFTVKKNVPTWNPIATIFRHDGAMPGFGEGRKALRFSALRALNGGFPTS